MGKCQDKQQGSDNSTKGVCAGRAAKIGKNVKRLVLHSATATDVKGKGVI